MATLAYAAATRQVFDREFPFHLTSESRRPRRCGVWRSSGISRVKGVAVGPARKLGVGSKPDACPRSAQKKGHWREQTQR